MSIRSRMVRNAAFALGIAAALGFGATQAVAGPNVCPRTSVGKCNSQESCQRTCTQMGLPFQGCSNGCCYCSLI